MGKVAAEIGRGADALAVLSKAKKFDFGKPPGPSAGALSEMAKSMIPYIARKTLLSELFPVGCGVCWCNGRNRKKKMEES